MAQAGNETNRKFCVKCDGAKSSGGLFTCDGCKQMFCSRHVVEHRQELDLRLESVVQEHDLIQQECSQLTQDQPVLRKIDVWEQISTRKIQQAANQLRAECRQLYQTGNESVKRDCSKLGQRLRHAREQEDYAESELIAWGEALSQLRSYLESMKTIDIVPERRSSLNLMVVRHSMGPTEDVSSSRYHSTEETDETTHNTPPRVDRLLDDLRPFVPRRVKNPESKGNNNRPNECKQQ